MSDKCLIKHVIFDWNGTLINDLALAVKGLNAVRDIQALPHIDANVYREHFGFPIRGFYQSLGIDCESFPFEDTIRSYLNIFNPLVGQCPLHQGAIEFLKSLRERGITVSVLSASQHDTLLENINNAGIQEFVDHTYGLKNTEATGKGDIAIRLDETLKNPGSQALMIGDTDHDVEVSKLCGWQMAAVSHGHQTHERLSAIHAHVYHNLISVYDAYFD